MPAKSVQDDRLDQAYLDAQVEYSAHGAYREAASAAFDRLADQCKPVPRIDDTRKPLADRHRDLAGRMVDTLAGSRSLSLGDWDDLFEFHAMGERAAAQKLDLLMFVADPGTRPEVRESMLGASVYRLPYTPPPHHATEARLAAAVRRAYRRLPPAEQRRVDRYVDLLDEECGGLVIASDGGVQTILPYTGTRGAFPRAS